MFISVMSLFEAPKFIERFPLVSVGISITRIKQNCLLVDSTSFVIESMIVKGFSLFKESPSLLSIAFSKIDVKQNRLFISVTSLCVALKFIESFPLFHIYVGAG